MDSYPSRAPRLTVGAILLRGARSIVVIVALVTLVTIVVDGRVNTAEIVRFIAQRWPLWCAVFAAIVIWDCWAARTRDR